MEKLTLTKQEFTDEMLGAMKEATRLTVERMTKLAEDEYGAGSFAVVIVQGVRARAMAELEEK